MFNKEYCIKGSDDIMIRNIYPEADFMQRYKLSKKGTAQDIAECMDMFPKCDIGGANIIIGSRNFVRWYIGNKKVINKILVFTPLFALTAFGLKSGFFLNLISQPVPAFPADVHQLVPAIPNTVPSLAPASILLLGGKAKATSASFFSGNGVILLHIMLIGFFTLIVSSFLKFTGRGDIIPLVAFVGGAIILKEVISLFNDIYGAIKTLISM